MPRHSFVSSGRVRAGRKLQQKMHHDNRMREKWLRENAKRAKKYWDILAREKQAKRLGAVRKMPGYHEKLSKAMQKYYQNPQAREKQAKIMKRKYFENPALIRKIDRAVTSWWREHPNLREVYRKRAMKLFLENPGKFRTFMNGGKNASKLKYKTKQGFIVRSAGEQKIANFLFERKIKSRYETKPLFFKKEGHICIPDFWLPESKIYIEFYGGHPKSWKKKVLKNKLYKKYKIKCVFITPAELRDLEYYLVGELKR